jgi:hypothetical protein
MYHDRAVPASCLAAECIWLLNDPLSLKFVMGLAPALDRKLLVSIAAYRSSIGCLRLLLEHGAPWDPADLVYAAGWNELALLEVVLQHSKEWSAKVPTAAASAGHVRFLMRIFDAGCPMWTSAHDGEPHIPARAFMPNEAAER